MNLSKREAEIFELLKSRIGEEVSMDDIMTHLKKDPTYLNARLSVNGSVKVLSYKLSAQGYSLERTTKIGRSSKASYRLSRPTVAGRPSVWPVGSPEDPE